MAMTNIVQKKMMQYFPEIQVFVYCLWSGFFFALQLKFELILTYTKPAMDN
jgi:hypothetical protein